MNKIRIDHYTLKLLKENLLYLITLIVLPVVFTVSLVILYNQYNQNKKTIDKLNSDNVNLKKKIDFIQYKGTLLTQNLDINQLTQVFSQLVPNTEDYFSILLSLENLSKISNFIITNYVVNLGASTKNVISISIEGQGDNNNFLDFLKNYNFSSGRLITVDKIEYANKAVTGSKITVNFYSGKPVDVPEEQIAFSDKDKQLLADIKDKVQIQLSPEAKPQSYTTKTVPF